MKVILVSVSTMCGRISPAFMGSALDRALLERLRSETDASLAGAETLRVADPEMRGPGGALPGHRIRAIMTGSGSVPAEGRRLFLTGPRPVFFTSQEQAAGLTLRLGQQARVIALPPGSCGLSVRAAINELQALGAESVLVEGGGRLNYSCLKEGVVDEIFLTIAPKLSGDRLVASMADGPGPLGEPFLDLRLISCEQAATGEVFLRYQVKK